MRALGARGDVELEVARAARAVVPRRPRLLGRLVALGLLRSSLRWRRPRRGRVEAAAGADLPEMCCSLLHAPDNCLSREYLVSTRSSLR